MRSFALCVMLFAAAAFAAPPSAEEMAKLQHDIQKAQSDSDKKYQGRELSPEEKKQQIKDRGAAENAVLEKAGVDRKEFARASAKLSKDDRAAVENEKAKLEKSDKAAAGGGAAKGGGGNGEVVIEKGGQGQMTPEEEAAAMDRQQGLGKSSGGSGKKRK